MPILIIAVAILMFVAFSVFRLGGFLLRRGTRRLRSSAGRAQISGIVRKMQWQSEEENHPITKQSPHSIKVCTFRVEGTDEDGNPQHLVTIEIRSTSGFSGDLSEGDQVAVYDLKRNGAGSIETAAVRNLTTGGIFGAKKQVSRRSVNVPPAQSAKRLSDGATV